MVARLPNCLHARWLEEYTQAEPPCGSPHPISRVSLTLSDKLGSRYASRQDIIHLGCTFLSGWGGHSEKGDFLGVPDCSEAERTRHKLRALHLCVHLCRMYLPSFIGEEAVLDRLLLFAQIDGCCSS